MAMCPEQELEIEKICNPKYGHSCCFFCRCSYSLISDNTL